MKKYVKAEIIAKNLPTGSYAAGCPTYNSQGGQASACEAGPGNPATRSCRNCEVTK